MQTKLTNEQMGQWIAHTRTRLQQTTQAVDCAALLLEQTANDHICGSWLSTQSNHALLIRKQGSYYEALVCDTSRGYKRYVQQFWIGLYRRRLQVVDYNDQPTGHPVVYDFEAGTLLFEPYGIFEPEQTAILHEYNRTIQQDEEDYRC